MTENIITLDQARMNDQVKKENPDVYKDAFRASGLTFVAGASLVMFPVGGAQAFILGTTAGVVGIIIGIIASLILNIAYFTRVKTQKADEAALLEVAQKMYPNAHAEIGSESIFFTPKK